VMSELESYGRQAQPGARRDDHASTNSVSDPDFVAAADAESRGSRDTAVLISSASEATAG